jgi:hypothetical protein
MKKTTHARLMRVATLLSCLRIACIAARMRRSS